MTPETHPQKIVLFQSILPQLRSVQESAAIQKIPMIVQNSPFDRSFRANILNMKSLNAVSTRQTSA